MPVRTGKDLARALKQGEIEPVYFLFGPETYLRDRAALAIGDEALRDTLLREFNESTFTLTSDDARAAIAAAEQLPMMSSRRVVRIRDFSRISEVAEETLLRYLERPVASSVVIFITEDIDKRRKLAKELMQRAAFEFQPLRGADLVTWARSHLQQLRTDIEPPALQRVLELVTSDVRTLSNELNKLAAAALPSRRITVELVDALARRSREHQNYELTDQILAGNGEAALRTLKNLLDDRVEPVMLIGSIAGAYRRLAMAKALQSRGAPPDEVFRYVRVPPFKQSAYLALLRRVEFATLARVIQRVAEADLAIKTSKAIPRMQVEMLVCELLI